MTPRAVLPKILTLVLLALAFLVACNKQQWLDSGAWKPAPAADHTGTSLSAQQFEFASVQDQLGQLPDSKTLLEFWQVPPPSQPIGKAQQN